MASSFVAVTGGAVALSAATAKSILGVIPATNKKLVLTDAAVTFDGTTSTAVPVLVELCASTGAGAGTSTGVTPAPTKGSDPTTVSASAAKNYSAEPTTLVAIREWLIAPTGGVIYQLPLGREPDAVNVASTTAKGGLFLRITAPAAVNVRSYMEFEE